jgi:hypothetical protein
MALVWGKIVTVKAKSTTEFPDNVDKIIVTVEPLDETKKLNRKFSFNVFAQRALDLRKQINPETVLNSNAIFSYDPDTNKVYLGIYNADAFAAIEKVVGEIPKMEIGKVTMGFSSKALHEGLKKTFTFDELKASYYELVPIEMEAPVQMYEFVAFDPSASTVEATDDIIEDTNEDATDETPELVAAGDQADVYVH